jgi:hypothetical protein
MITETEVVIDLTGPIIDITKIPDFGGIRSIRYLKEEQIASQLCRKLPRADGWREKDVLNVTKEALKSKFRMHLIDDKVVELICKAKSFGAKIKIISATKDTEVFDAAKDSIIAFSKVLMKEGRVSNELEESDFVSFAKESLANLQEFIDKKLKAGSFRIVFDDEVDIDILSKTDSENIVAKWISGFRDINYIQKFKDLITERERVAKVDEAIKKLATDDTTINIADFALLNNSFYVFDNEIKQQLSDNVEAIKAVIEKGVAKTKPICVFLAGAPGTGKSFFVKLFSEYIEAKPLFPTASLSGVPENKFADAIREHINNVYSNSLYINAEKPRIAFLDEVDTKGGVLAFRFLMDAMTGSFTNDKGELEKNETERLVWVFAGSAALRTEDLVLNFQRDDKKVTDFIDRIHFSLVLPTVDEPGQAILTFLSTLKQFIEADSKSLSNVYVSKYILRLFGLTAWKSARQINTVCRIVYAKATFTDDKIELKLKDFEDVANKLAVIPEIKETYKAICKHFSNTDDSIKEEAESDFAKIKYPNKKE